MMDLLGVNEAGSLTRGPAWLQGSAECSLRCSELPGYYDYLVICYMLYMSGYYDYLVIWYIWHRFMFMEITG